MHKLAVLDRRYVWHPFTQMRDWLKAEPIVIVEGAGAVLRDIKGREYLDANSSIWTNLHGHNQPKINAAIQQQLRKIAHSSALGLANEPASLLAAQLVRVANPEPLFPKRRKGERGKGSQNSIRPASLPPFPLSKVFFSDDGSTSIAVEPSSLKKTFERGKGGRDAGRIEFWLPFPRSPFLLFGKSGSGFATRTSCAASRLA